VRRAILAAAAGRDLGAFFDGWLFRAEKPASW
jgi:hypothetical protein